MSPKWLVSVKTSERNDGEDTISDPGQYQQLQQYADAIQDYLDATFKK